MNRLSKSFIYPFKIIRVETQKSLLWFVFTVICGFIGIAMNVWSHLAPKVSLYDAILQEFNVNSFYTFSIVLLSCTAGSLYMKIDKDKMITFTTVKIWLSIVLVGFVFIGAFLCQSRGKIENYNYYQMVYLILTVILAVYNFCVVNLDRHPDLFVDIENTITEEDADQLKILIDKMETVKNDKKGNAL